MNHPSYPSDRRPEENAQAIPATAMAYIPASWEAFASRVKATWNRLNDVDLYPTRGRREALIDLIQEKTGQDRLAIASQLSAIERECGTLTALGRLKTS